MVRPHKERCVNSLPTACIYKPAGIPARELEWVTLTLDEYEAIRLIDHENMEQKDAAELMGISRPTVTRIYGAARKKIAHALVLGQALKIEGGPVVQGRRGGHGKGGRGMGHGHGNGCGRGRGSRFLNQQEQTNENSDSSSS